MLADTERCAYSGVSTRHSAIASSAGRSYAFGRSVQYFPHVASNFEILAGRDDQDPVLIKTEEPETGDRSVADLRRLP
jgi:3-methyladenine DNA glycosylase Mpg